MYLGHILYMAGVALTFSRCSPPTITVGVPCGSISACAATSAASRRVREPYVAYTQRV